ncbi:MAG TPA: 3,4-dihydroxy-2-butanone-4-phosphate synthase [Myxococcota bacterium]|nr:3,4-dihydroxy-2-butanone-4-phosphate synthase [Myxococcota bacterium]
MTNNQMEFAINCGLANMTPNFARAINALRDGKIILLLDAHDRENEGDLLIAAEKITAESMNFLIKKGSGVVCLAMPKSRLDELGLPLMIPDNTNFFQTAFTVSIEAKTGVTTGVSARDRAHTIQVAIADNAESSHLARPGHVFPLSARKNGIFDRMGHTEGSVDLMRIAGLKPGAVLCELMSEDGSMTTGEDRVKFAKSMDMPVVTIEEVLFYRIQTESVMTKSVKELPSRFGKLVWTSYRYFDQVSVDVFHQEKFLAKANAVRLAVDSGGNIFKRFLAQALLQTSDDALVHALTRIAKGEADVSIICHSEQTAKAFGEISLLENASICRSMQDLGVRAIDVGQLDAEIARIANTYFSIGLE